jgi:phage terminase small subunit
MSVKRNHKLNPKQRLFVKEYLADLNATAAAIRSGYSAKNAGKIGPAMLGNSRISVEIQSQMDKRSQRTEIKADNVLQEIAKLAFSNMLDYMAANSEGQMDIDLSRLTREQAAAIQEITVDTTGGSGDGERRKVLRTKFKLADKGLNLERLGRHLKLFTDKIEVSTDSAIIARLVEGRKRVASKG